MIGRAKEHQSLVKTFETPFYLCMVRGVCIWKKLAFKEMWLAANCGELFPHWHCIKIIKELRGNCRSTYIGRMYLRKKKWKFDFHKSEWLIDPLQQIHNLRIQVLMTKNTILFSQKRQQSDKFKFQELHDVLHYYQGNKLLLWQSWKCKISSTTPLFLSPSLTISRQMSSPTKNTVKTFEGHWSRHHLGVVSHFG